MVQSVALLQILDFCGTLKSLLNTYTFVKIDFYYGLTHYTCETSEERRYVSYTVSNSIDLVLLHNMVYYCNHIFAINSVTITGGYV